PQLLGLALAPENQYARNEGPAHQPHQCSARRDHDERVAIPRWYDRQHRQCGFGVIQLAVQIANRQCVGARFVGTPVQLRFVLNRSRTYGTPTRVTGWAAGQFDLILPPARRRTRVQRVEAKCGPAPLHECRQLRRVAVRTVRAHDQGGLDRSGPVAPETHQPTVGAKPHRAVGPLLDGIDDVARQTVPRVQQRPRRAIEARNTGVHPHPKQPVAIVEETPDIAGQHAAFVDALGGTERRVEAKQPLGRAKPDLPVGIERYGANATFKSVRGRERVEHPPIPQEGAGSRADPDVPIRGRLDGVAGTADLDRLRSSAIELLGNILGSDPQPDVGRTVDGADTQVAQPGGPFQLRKLVAFGAPYACNRCGLPCPTRVPPCGADPNRPIRIHVQPADDGGPETTLAAVAADGPPIEPTKDVTAGSTRTFAFRTDEPD